MASFVGTGNTQTPPSGSCAIFQFVVDTVLTGLLCLFGFVTNTLCFIMLWKEKNNLAITFLLQALLIADFTLVWMIFIADVVPGLGYAVPILGDCTDICYHVAMVTRPVLYIAQFSVLWLTLAAAVNRFVVMCKPEHVSLVCTVEFARKQVLVVLLCAVLFCLPLTFDGRVRLIHTDQNGTSSMELLKQNKWYHAIYLNAFILVVFLLIPLVLAAYMGTRLVLVLQSIKRLRRALAATHKVQNTDMSRVLLTILISTFICYLPLTVLRVVQWPQEDSSHLCGHLQYYLDSFCKMFLVMNSSSKLVIIGLFVHHFWQAVRATFNRKYDKKGHFDMFGGIYRCQDMSEMTLMSQAESQN